MGHPRNDILPGTLDLLILQTLEPGEAHGYAIMERVWNSSGELFRVEEGALYPALHRLEAKGWLRSSWGESEAKRRAKYYKLTAAGRRHLNGEKQRWRQLAAGMGRVLESGGQ
jgi:PadR family transcriptional regulator, regulatory protein PadR